MINLNTVKKVHLVGPTLYMPEAKQTVRKLTGSNEIEIQEVPTDKISIEDESSPFKELYPVMSKVDIPAGNQDTIIVINPSDSASHAFARLCQSNGPWSLHPFAINSIAITPKLEHGPVFESYDPEPYDPADD